MRRDGPGRYTHAWLAVLRRPRSVRETVVGRIRLFLLERRSRGHHREIVCSRAASAGVVGCSRRDRGNGRVWLFCPDGQHRFLQLEAV